MASPLLLFSWITFLRFQHDFSTIVFPFQYLLLELRAHRKQPLYLHKVGLRLHTHHPPKPNLWDCTEYVVVKSCGYAPCFQERVLFCSVCGGKW
uniref:Putative ovule protein n=1 Tax=Solanum chacoense TaxID=4108 RepID=A0A0V0ICI1_SOLCH